ncbi:uncharacterized protein I303_107058 [Kwoniella dejecticola CBS 10117]|uniref:Uncharacterized protein n=1 Tax=Kwoniella dejecticola CBS 10117 TaxID=1296121 RepID=A0A1A5ZYL3_9TREE|nr:uncharacterized protein I303_06458 [Kwoniella dejecticola CBS 10117]OBR82901.1 hypothetical protein I303_06458 [Kwoniella dejecticola CBS 10117]
MNPPLGTHEQAANSMEIDKVYRCGLHFDPDHNIRDDNFLQQQLCGEKWSVVPVSHADGSMADHFELNPYHGSADRAIPDYHFRVDDTLRGSLMGTLDADQKSTAALDCFAGLLHTQPALDLRSLWRDLGAERSEMGYLATGVISWTPRSRRT